MVTKFDNDQLADKVKILAPAIGLGLLLAIIGLKMVATSWGKATNYQENKQRWDQQAADYKSKVNYFSTVDQERLGQMEKVLSEAVFKQDKSYYLVGVIKNIAADYDFTIDGFQAQVGEIGKDKPAGKVDSVNLSIKVVMYGPKEKYLDLVTRLERTLPVLSIRNFEIKSAQNMVGIDMGVDAFFVPKTGEASVDNLSLNDLVLSDKELELIGQLEQYQKYSGNETGGVTPGYVMYQKTNPFIP